MVRFLAIKHDKIYVECVHFLLKTIRLVGGGVSMSNQQAIWIAP